MLAHTHVFDFFQLSLVLWQAEPALYIELNE